MRGLLLGIVLSNGVLCCPGSVCAGVYRRSEMEMALPTGMEGNNSIQSRRSGLRSIDDRANVGVAADKISFDRRECLREVAELEEKEKKGGLTPAEEVDLSGGYLRLGRFDKAIDLLEKRSLPKLEDEPLRFQLLANLAMAYWDRGVPSWAIDRQRASLKAWPLHHPGWTWEQWHRIRRAEQLLLLLMLRRQGELEGRPPDSKDLKLDVVFPGVRFSGPTGKYEVGALEPASAEKLPADAEALVIQLMLWLPTDDRLFWYYGELLNAKGKIQDAYKVLDLLVYVSKMGNIPEVFDHRRALKQAVADAPKVKNEEKTTKPEASAPAAPPAPLLDWRQLSVGFAAGLLVMLIAQLQWQEWRRRRALASVRAAAAGPAHPAGVSVSSDER